jgi:hypothetical protein
LAAVNSMTVRVTELPLDLQLSKIRCKYYTRPRPKEALYVVYIMCIVNC